MKVETIKQLDGWKGDARLVRRGDDYFVVSGVVAPYSGWEVLVFRSNEKGEVDNYLEVAGGISHEDAIAQLEAGMD